MDMSVENHMPGPGGSFPTTRLSVVDAAGSSDPDARRRGFETLVTLYWKPVYKYLRLRFRVPPETAEDWTQGFFARAFEKGFFDRYDPSRAKFRTYLRTCLDGYAGHQRQAARRLKRGGGAPLLSLDFQNAEGELQRLEIPDDVDLDELFHREWTRSVFQEAVQRLETTLREAGKEVHFRLFRRYDLEGADDPERPTYAQLARDEDIPATQVTNFLALARRELRTIVLDLLAEVTGSDRELREEARSLLGVEIS